VIPISPRLATALRYLEYARRAAGFIDYFHGRGVLFIFCALRIIPLGNATCLAIGMITLAFGFLNIVCELAIDAHEGISHTARKYVPAAFRATSTRTRIRVCIIGIRV
jgi:hypothetical protein